MLPFLSKHFALDAYIEQPNRFVVFNSAAALQ
jgi:hypothetical protein